MRMTVSRGSMNRSAKDGGLPPDSVVQDEDAILADSERVLKLFHDPRPGAKIRIALAPCSPFSISKGLMIESAKLAEGYDCQLHTHLCETDDEEQFCLGMYGVRPVDLLEETGWMSLARLARARDPFQRGGDRAARARRRRRLPLRRLEHGARLRHLPHMRTRGGGRAGRARSRRIGVQRFLEHDGGRPPRPDDRPAALRRRCGDPSRRAALGDRGLGALPGAQRHRPDRRGPRGRPRAVHARRTALFGRARSARGADPVRRASGRPGDGRGRLAGGRRRVVGLDLGALIAAHKAAAKDFA